MNMKLPKGQTFSRGIRGALVTIASVVFLSCSYAFAGMANGLMGEQTINKTLRATTFTMTSVYPQIFTPNGDGRNDHVEFQFDNPMDANTSGKVFDLRGTLVSDLRTGLSYESLMWDGKTTNGSIAPPGTYVYQIEVTGAESKVINGLIVIAK
jgi:gliding motility-associated-like protein